MPQLEREIGVLRTVEYALEYGSNTLEIHRDAIAPGQRVLVVDDLLATGGTVVGTIDLIRQLKGEVVGCSFLVELLATIPSVVYGLWGIFVLVPFVRSLEASMPESLRQLPIFSAKSKIGCAAPLMVSIAFQPSADHWISRAESCSRSSPECAL